MNWRNRFDWMEAGREYVPESDRDAFLSAIMAIDFDTGNGNQFGEWLRTDHAIALPMSQGLALQAMVERLRIPNVSAVCHSCWSGRYGLLGVRGRYRKPEGGQHTVELFGIDYGGGVAIVCARVFEDVIPDSDVLVRRG